LKFCHAIPQEKVIEKVATSTGLIYKNGSWSTIKVNLKIAVGSSKSDPKPELARFAGNERDSPHG
jgi:hypothetical protein